MPGLGIQVTYKGFRVSARAILATSQSCAHSEVIDVGQVLKFGAFVKREVV